MVSGVSRECFTCIGETGYNLTGNGINCSDRDVKGVFMIEYKVVELAVVTDESIEVVLNARTAEGWHFDGMQFVISEASKRPSMAFVLFTRDLPG